MKYSVETESEVASDGSRIPYDIFSNCFQKTMSKIVPHIHSYYETICITEGQQAFLINNEKTVILSAGDIIFIPPYTVHEMYIPKNESSIPMRSIVVKFSPLFLYPMEATRSDVKYLLSQPFFEKSHYLFRQGEPNTAALEPILKTIFSEKQNKLPGYELALRGQLIGLYLFLVRNCAVQKKQESDSGCEINAEDAQKLYRALNYLKENYQYNISMQEVAEACGLNYYRFSRLFKKMTNRKFNEYLLEMRLNHSQKMLLQSEKTVSEISMECGFEYVAYFIQNFKKKNGITPKEYRIKYRQSSL